MVDVRVLPNPADVLFDVPDIASPRQIMNRTGVKFEKQAAYSRQVLGHPSSALSAEQVLRFRMLLASMSTMGWTRVDVELYAKITQAAL